MEKISGSTISSPIKSALAVIFISLILTSQTGAIPILDAGDELLDQQFELDSAPPLNASDKQLGAALELLNTGKYKAAISAIDDYLKQHPKSAPGHEIRGAALALSGKFDASIKAMNEALKYNPKQYSALTKLGDIYFSLGDAAKAETFYLKSAAIEPKERKNHQRLGYILEKKGKVEDAIKQYELGIEGTPIDYVGIKARLARLYNQLGRFDDAITLLAGPLKLNSDHLGHIVLGTSYLQLGKLEQASEQFLKAKQLKPKHPGTLLSLGIVYRQQKQVKKSIEQLQELVTLEPKWSASHYQLALGYRTNGQLELAAKSFETAIKYSPQPNHIYLELAQVNIGLQRYDDAISICKKLLDSEQSDKAFQLLGLANQMRGDAKTGIQLVTQLAKKYPKSVAAQQVLGDVSAFYQQYPAAMQAYENALKLSPKNIQILKNKAAAELQAGKKLQARSTAKSLSELYPESNAERFYYASILEASGDASNAKTMYKKILAAEPEHVGSLNNLALLYANDGQSSEAIKLAAKAHLLIPKNPEIWDTYGWVLHLAGKHQQALDYLSKALEAAPKNSSFLYHVASAQSALGEHDKALQSVNLALKLSQDFSESAEAVKLQGALMRK